MAAQYPSQITTQLIKNVDLEDVVFAADVNDAYDEIIAIQTTVGANPGNPGTWGSAEWSEPVSFSTVAARIKNLENGAYFLQRRFVSNLGSSVIQPSTSSTKGLVIRGAASQTAALFEIQNSSGTSLGTITAAGVVAMTIDGGTA
jgi:hypothetical protein